MDLWIKTLGWMIVSSLVCFIALTLAGAEWHQALIAVACTATRTPCHVVYEWVYERLNLRYHPKGMLP